jgi:NAD-dependent deacetylase
VKLRPDGSIVVLTGAGISAESGLATFRGAGGLWEGHRVEEVATPEAFQKNPKLVQDFYNHRRRQLLEVEPNLAHKSLVHLEKNWKGSFLLVTQNVDDLHDRAGNQNLLHMHGELKKVRCLQSGTVLNWEDDILGSTVCNCCSKQGTLRPHIVWFGEMPLNMEIIYEELRRCDLFISIGTSGQVYPAAGFVSEASSNGKAWTIEVNTEKTGTNFDEARVGPASHILPEMVETLLNLN